MHADPSVVKHTISSASIPGIHEERKRRDADQSDEPLRRILRENDPALPQDMLQRRHSSRDEAQTVPRKTLRRPSPEGERGDAGAQEGGPQDGEAAEKPHGRVPLIRMSHHVAPPCLTAALCCFSMSRAGRCISSLTRELFFLFSAGLGVLCVSAVPALNPAAAPSSLSRRARSRRGS